VSRLQLGCSWLASIRVGPGVQPLQGENYTYSRVLGYGQPNFYVVLIRVVLLMFLPHFSGYFLPGVAKGARSGSSRADLVVLGGVYVGLGIRGARLARV
jgi:hypothetical protein